MQILCLSSFPVSDQAFPPQGMMQQNIRLIPCTPSTFSSSLLELLMFVRHSWLWKSKEAIRRRQEPTRLWQSEMITGPIHYMQRQSMICSSFTHLVQIVLTVSIPTKTWIYNNNTYFIFFIYKHFYLHCLKTNSYKNNIVWQKSPPLLCWAHTSV